MAWTRRLGCALLVGWLAACGSSEPSASPTIAPAPSATAAAARGITFTATDGVRLSGRLYGTGTTAVVLSNMGDNDPALWDAFAPRLADRGYLVLTYSYRYPAHTSSFDSGMATHTVDDLRGAIAQLRVAGATRFVLAGASLGGMATAKVAAAEKPAAMVVLSSPVDLTDYGFHVTPAELRTAVPKLFVGSSDDTTVPYAETVRMDGLATGPKELHGYSGTEHGLHLFDGEHAADLTERLIAFVTTNAPVSG